MVNARLRLLLRDVGAYAWASRALRATRGDDEVSFERSPAPLPPRWARGGARGFDMARRLHYVSPVIDAHARQGWRAAHGERVLLHIGVRSERQGFGFTAWLDGDPQADDAGLVILASRDPDGDISRGSAGRATTPNTEPSLPRAQARVPRLVSVILPAHNAEPTIAAQLHALATQCYPGDWELVVVNDGSSDGTSEQLDHAPVELHKAMHLLRHPARRGPGAARNTGAAAASGELLAFCDADDVVSRSWLAELANAAGVADLVGGFNDSLTLNRGSRALSGWTADRLPSINGLAFASGSNMALWADVLQAVGGFDERYQRNGDVELSARLRRQGFELAFAPRAVVYYRHRTTARALARQQLLAGIDTVRLYRDLRDSGMHRSLTSAARAWVRLIGRSARVLRSSHELRLRWLASLSFRVGRLIGCVRHRTLFP